jgi:lysine decarboxylase
MDIRRACDEHPEASAVLITSPNYYGMLSDIRAIADIVHRSGMILIVDQAHGAHLRFCDYLAQQQRDGGKFVKNTRTSAESQGADIVINSTHKTLFSFTGSGILNICSDRADKDAVIRTLRMLQTTSPSYIAMGSLDINERIMRVFGRSVMEHWMSDIASFYDRASRIHGLTVVDCAGMDLTKINISMASLGISGTQLDRELRARNIIPEMVHGNYVMLMTGAGSRTGDYAALLTALKDISDSYAAGAAGRAAAIIGKNGLALRSEPDFDLVSADVPAECDPVPLYASEGRVLYDPIIIYPPGSPVVCPGEIMSMDAISYISEAIARGEKAGGVDDEGMILVGRR